MSESEHVSVEDESDEEHVEDEGLSPMALLERVRTEPRLYVAALAISIVVGLALSTIDWLGLVVGGALVGIVSENLLRAVGAGLLFGVIVLAAFLVTLGGSATAVPEMTPIVFVTVGAAIALPILGSLARGVFP